MGNPWSILGLEPTDDLSRVRRTYAQLVRLYHPEEFPDKYQEISAAYQTVLALIRRGQVQVDQEDKYTPSTSRTSSVEKAESVGQGKRLQAANEVGFDFGNLFQGEEKGGEQEEEVKLPYNQLFDQMGNLTVNQYELERRFYHLLAYEPRNILAWKELLEVKEQYQALLDLLIREDVVILLDTSLINLIRGFIEFHEEQPQDLPYYQRLLYWRDFLKYWNLGQQTLANQRVMAFDLYLKNTAFTQKLLTNPILLNDKEAWQTFYRIHYSQLNFYRRQELAAYLYKHREKIFEPEIIQYFLSSPYFSEEELTPELSLLEDSLTDRMLELAEEKRNQPYSAFLRYALHPLLFLVTLLVTGRFTLLSLNNSPFYLPAFAILGFYYLYYQFYYYRAMLRWQNLSILDATAFYCMNLLYLLAALFAEIENVLFWSTLVALSSAYFFGKLYLEFQSQSKIYWTNPLIFIVTGNLYYLTRLLDGPVFDWDSLLFFGFIVFSFLVPFILLFWAIWKKFPLVHFPKEFWLICLPGLGLGLLLIHYFNLAEFNLELFRIGNFRGLSSFFLLPFFNSFWLLYQRKGLRETYYSKISYYQNILLSCYALLTVYGILLSPDPISVMEQQERQLFFFFLEIIFVVSRFIIYLATYRLSSQRKLPSAIYHHF